MSEMTIAAFTVLLLPVPLSFMVPASHRAEPDPWKIQRLRTSLMCFATLVAVIYGLALRQLGSFDAGRLAPGGLVAGIFIWSAMAWILFGILVFELRRSRPDPFPGVQVRSASLAPRQRLTPVPPLAWWILRGAWGLTVAFLVSKSSYVPATSLVLLASGLVLLLIGPRLERTHLVGGPEPLLDGAPAEPARRLERAYSMRRAFRSWSIYVMFATSVAYKACLAVLMADVAVERDRSALTLIALGAVLAQLVVLALLEVSSHRRIRVLRRACVKGSSSSTSSVPNPRAEG